MECLESWSPEENCWEVAKHSLQGPEFGELGPQIAKSMLASHLLRELMTMLTASWMNTRQARNAGATKDKDGLPSARIANVM